MSAAQKRYDRPNRLTTNDGEAKKIIESIAKERGIKFQAAHRLVLRRGLAAMGYFADPADEVKSVECPRCRRQVSSCTDHDPTVSHLGTEPFLPSTTTGDSMTEGEAAVLRQWSGM